MLRKNSNAKAFEADQDQDQGTHAAAAVTENVTPAAAGAEVPFAAPVVDVATPAAAAVSLAPVEVTQGTSVAVAPAIKPATLVPAAKMVPSVPKGNRYKAAFDHFESAFDPHDFDFDTFPRITAGLDGFTLKDTGEELGKKIVIQLLSFNERYVVSAGEDTDEGNAAVRFSLDGITLDDGSMTVAEYLHQLQTVDGFDDASKKKYVAIYGMLVSKTKEGQTIKVDAKDREIVTIQVPPRSVAKFQGFRATIGVKVSQGHMVESDMIQLEQIKVAGTKKDYAGVLFAAA